MKPVLGIVGGIGSGKSYVASLFAKHGCCVVDADALGHEALLEPNIKEQVRNRWGESVFNSNGEVDRKKLAAIVFAHPDEKARLEAIVFPFIKKGILSTVHDRQDDPDVKLFILDAAILLETGWKNFCKAILFVDASLPTRLKRVTGRGWTASELYRRESTQWSLEEKKAAARHIIPNEGNEVLTETLVIDLINRYARQ